LLGYLLLHRGEPLGRKHVAFALWPDASEEEALAHLRRHIYLVRRALPASPGGADWIAADRSSLRWEPADECWLDVEEFESQSAIGQGAAPSSGGRPSIPALERAVSLYAGDLLPDCYDDWVLPDRERLRRLYAEALARLAALRACLGDLRGAVSAAESLVAHDNLREDAQRTLIAMRYLAGDRAAALAAFDECQRVLADELDVEPIEETVRLAAAIRAAEPPAEVLDLIRQDLTDDIKALVLAARSVPNNLPCPLTSFVGRESELDDVLAQMADHRLLTLTGPGGCGKTRLALEATRQLLRGSRTPPGDGVWYVDFAPLDDPDLVPQAVAGALGIEEEPGVGLLDTLEREMRLRRMLLVLDNCEPVAEGCAILAERLLVAAPDVRALATSRQP
jgi:DNA-binding SARP family transcriptional activator